MLQAFSSKFCFLSGRCAAILFFKFNTTNTNLRWLAQVITSKTQRLRLCALMERNVDITECQSDLVPCKRMHFKLCGYALTTSVENPCHEQLSVANITMAMIVKSDPRQGKSGLSHTRWCRTENVTAAVATIVRDLSSTPCRYRCSGSCPTLASSSWRPRAESLWRAMHR